MKRNTLSHYGVKGMKWGVRRDQRTLDRMAGRKTPKARLTSREKKIITGSVLSGLALASIAGVYIYTLKVRNTQANLLAAKGFGWVEKILAGDTENYQTLSAKEYRDSKEVIDTIMKNPVLQQAKSNKALLDYINGLA